jgi:hypothetical protein
VYNAITQNGVYDPRKGYAVPIGSALSEGLIDTRAVAYLNPITQERISLEEASQRGLVDSQTYQALTTPCLTDHGSGRKLNLVQAVDAKLVDPRWVGGEEGGEGGEMPVSCVGLWPVDVPQLDQLL